MNSLIKTANTIECINKSFNIKNNVYIIENSSSYAFDFDKNRIYGENKKLNGIEYLKEIWELYLKDEIFPFSKQDIKQYS